MSKERAEGVFHVLGDEYPEPHMNKMEDYMTPESIELSDKLYQELLKKQNVKAINDILRSVGLL